MRTIRLPSSFAAGAVVLSLAAGACGQTDRDTARDQDGRAAASSDAAANRNSGASMTVTGCLQQGDGNNDFILTEVNEQPAPVATSGENASGAVQQKQQEAASRAYKLNGGPENMRELVGQQVRISGTVEDRGEAGSRDQSRSVDEDDLASMQVASAESVGSACGNPAGNQGGQSPRRRD
jgi:hypothetical protein